MTLPDTTADTLPVVGHTAAAVAVRMIPAAEHIAAGGTLPVAGCIDAAVAVCTVPVAEPTAAADTLPVVDCTVGVAAATACCSEETGCAAVEAG